MGATENTRSKKQGPQGEIDHKRHIKQEAQAYNAIAAIIPRPKCLPKKIDLQRLPQQFGADYIERSEENLFKHELSTMLFS